MSNFLAIMEKAVCTLGSITLQDQNLKSNNYHFLCVGRLINILIFISVSTSKLDRKIQYHENRTFLFCLSILVSHQFNVVALSCLTTLYTDGQKKRYNRFLSG